MESSEEEQGDRSSVDTIGKGSNGVGIAADTLPRLMLLQETCSSSIECLSSERSEPRLQAEGPTGQVEVERVATNPRTPPVVAEEEGNVEEVHPFWQLLKLAGYLQW